jgi:Cu+-exporting ATPase
LEKEICDHCRLEFDKDVLLHEKVDGEDLYFCCKGCQGVYHLLHSEGLDSFYEKAKDTKLDPVSVDLSDLERFDLEGFTKKYVKSIDGYSQVSLIIDGIHCSACVWLNEKVLHQSDGIIEAEINFTTHKAKIVWDDEVLKLSDIIKKIRSIGYNAYPYDSSIQEQKANKDRKDYYIKLLVGIFATMNVMWLAIAQYAGYFTGMRSDIKEILQWAQFILATPTLFFTGWVYFKGAYFGLKNRFINMDFLVATGATLAYLYSIYAMITGRGETYFESVIMIITFVFVGKYLEILSKKKAVDTLDSMRSSLPTEVTLIYGDEKSIVGVDDVKVGDIIELKAGDKVVIDGSIVMGEGSFDESSLTGESKPIFKSCGDFITSGTINLDALIRYRVTKVYGDSMLANIVSLLENSLSKKPKIEKIANEISGYFSVTILLISIATFIGWYYYGGSFERALIVAISVIVIACPCALGLATPMATLVGLSKGAKRGILFKEAGFLETFAKSDVIFLDKTGTLTKGRPKVIKHSVKTSYDLNLLYSLTKSSTHPISRGIYEYLEAHHSDLKIYDLEDVKTIQAKGLSAEFEGKMLLGGSKALFEDLKDLDEDGSIFIFSINGKIVDLFVLEDSIKDGAREVVKELKKSGLEVVMLTGDNEKVASKVAKEVAIDKFRSNLYPQDKLKIVDDYHDMGKMVVMVGDGINDALALSKSDIAIAMGSGSDVSIDVSDVVLLDDDIKSLAVAYRLSKKTYTNIKQNLSISLIYNLVTIPLAVSGLVIPLIAALSMSLSSLIVVANALRINRGE